MRSYLCGSTGAQRILAASTRVAARPSIFSSEAQREQFLTGLLRWLLDHITMFDPPQEEEVEADAPEVVLPDRSRKAFGELGAALRLAYRVPALAERAQIATLRSEWLRMARHRNIFFDAARRIHLFPHRAVSLAILQTLEHMPIQAHRTLQRVLDLGWIDRTERSAWHKLDLKYYFDAAGLRHIFPDDAKLFAQSSLANLPALPYVTRSDLYGVTHLVFHFADFGRTDIAALGGGACHRRLADFVEGALAMSLHERDFDLTEELLINRLCLEVGPDALDRVATDAVCEAQQPSGFVPDLAWLAGLPPQSSPELAAESEFFAVYHPTVVGLFLVATDMDSERVIPGGA